jgi:hypothetical protein
MEKMTSADAVEQAAIRTTSAIRLVLLRMVLRPSGSRVERASR